MPLPSPQDQVRFLLNVQRLLSEGMFTATYKYALLLAVADLSVERGEDAEDGLELSTEQIAEKFVGSYWRQAMPYPSAAAESESALLRQNNDRQAAIVHLVASARAECGGSLPGLQRDRVRWRRLIR